MQTCTPPLTRSPIAFDARLSAPQNGTFRWSAETRSVPARWWRCDVKTGVDNDEHRKNI